ncbi:SxtJ family membrane protein [Aquimarina sp. 2201CG5-10]|uniref:SxtJ family membrane protein n=1 Tax=Aquimarina callyspongiae TaxID=3098150 RepID=UPI002AB453F8|nr:SxtJ family membrane protein [Aquimarina sp. 2201CG5-10]MDY8138856.1 SxtJ family membrane protein [Aquimarina sp. 2201CG5-10]
MNWIKLLYAKAITNSSLRKIQIQFLVILFVATIGVIGYQFYIQNWTLNTSLIATGVIALVFGIIYKKPIVLKPLLLIWLLFGLLLGEITSTIILGFIFYFLFFPITFILRVKNRKKQTTHPRWILRENDQIDYNKLY